MARAHLFVLPAAVLLALPACQTPQDRLPQELPEAVAPRPYAELLTRARTQAKVATEAFYVDRWGDLEDAAHGLDQTARYLAKAEEVPAKHKAALMSMSDELAKEAKNLKEAARKKSVEDANAVLTRINLKVRSMKLDE
jgi:hypothetical protein